MSAQTTPSVGAEAFSEPAHVSDKGGSPSEIREDGAETEVSADDPVGDDESPSDQFEAAEGASPEATQSQSGSPAPDVTDRVAELEAELAERDGLLGQVAEAMDRDPELRARLSGQKAPEKSLTWSTRIEKGLKERLKPEAAEALLEVLQPFFEDYETVRGEVGGLRNTARNLAQTVGSREFVRALSENGVSSEVQASQPFQKFLRTLRANRSYQRVEASDNQFAAEIVGSKWHTARARQSVWKDDRSRIESAKTGRAPQGANRGTSLADRVIEIVREPGGNHLDQASKIRLDYIRKGTEPPKIRYVDKKSS